VTSSAACRRKAPARPGGPSTRRSRRCTIPVLPSRRAEILRFSFAGQSCISVQRIYVARDAYDGFLQRFRAGVTVNEAPTFRADQMPYGGVKDSGNTREGPAYAVRELTEERVLVLQL
jgi:acyl-CoA reductase-like NAD-dependent aldehyde dehydrogenase